MTVTEIQNFLKKASESGVRPGLDRMIELCHRLGDPQVRVPSIHVAGTNGKGSTSAYMASILSCAGKKVGWYSSPAVIDRREPFRILNREGTSAQVSFREQVIRKISCGKHIRILNCLDQAFLDFSVK